MCFRERKNIYITGEESIQSASRNHQERKKEKKRFEIGVRTNLSNDTMVAQFWNNNFVCSCFETIRVVIRRYIQQPLVTYGNRVGSTLTWREWALCNKNATTCIWRGCKNFNFRPVGRKTDYYTYICVKKRISFLPNPCAQITKKTTELLPSAKDLLIFCLLPIFRYRYIGKLYEVTSAPSLCPQNQKKKRLACSKRIACVKTP